MKITKRRIRTLKNYLIGIKEDEDFYIALTDLTLTKKICDAGFTTELNVGEQILPSIKGPKSRFNANGGYNINRKLPKETLYRQTEIKDWRGNYHTVSIPYKRYPRTIIEAPEVELLVVENDSGEKIIRSPKLNRKDNSEKEIIHVINLFLELFSECDTLQTSLLPIFNVSVTRLNWNLLPQGKYPWEKLKDNVTQIIGNVRPMKRRIIERRLETISENNPNFVAVGNAGFKGYVVFGFEDKDFYILESINQNHATYVFGENWEKLSQLSKGEILNNNLHEKRIIHTKDWIKIIKNLF